MQLIVGKVLQSIGQKHPWRLLHWGSQVDQQIIAQGLTDAFKENHINPTCPEQIFACENTSSVFYCLSIFACIYIDIGMRTWHWDVF